VEGRGVAWAREGMAGLVGRKYIGVV